MGLAIWKPPRSGRRGESMRRKWENILNLEIGERIKYDPVTGLVKLSESLLE